MNTVPYNEGLSEMVKEATISGHKLAALKVGIKRFLGDDLAVILIDTKKGRIIKRKGVPIDLPIKKKFLKETSVPGERREGYVYILIVNKRPLKGKIMCLPSGWSAIFTLNKANVQYIDVEEFLSRKAEFPDE